MGLVLLALAACRGEEVGFEGEQTSPTTSAGEPVIEESPSLAPEDEEPEDAATGDFSVTFVLLGEIQADDNQLNRYVMPSIGEDPQQVARDCVNEVVTASTEVYCWVFPSRGDFEAAEVSASGFELLCWTHSAGAGVDETRAEDRLENVEIEYGCPSADEEAGDEGLEPANTEPGDGDTCAGYTSWFLSDPTPEYIEAMRGWAEVAEDPELADALRRNADLAENDRSAWNTDFDVTDRCDELGF